MNGTASNERATLERRTAWWHVSSCRKPRQEMVLAHVSMAVLAGCLMMVHSAVAQAADSWPGYAPKTFRWDEDYAWLAVRPWPSLEFPLALKHVALDADGRLAASFGGEYRIRLDTDERPDFGARGAASFTSKQQRFLAHADLHMGPDLRVFVQLGAATEHGREPGPRPADRSDIDLSQAFVDIGWGEAGERSRLRLGRQEIAIGRYVAVREVTNLRRTFDGVRFDGPIGDWSLSAVAARATRNRPGAFDDSADRDDALLAIVAEHVLPFDMFKGDLAVLQHDNLGAHYGAGTGVERRRTIGARAFGNHAGWDMDAQASYQFGDYTPTGQRPLEISAWGAAFEGGRALDLAWMPRVAIRVDVASGDSNSHDRHLGTFDLPYPNLAYLSDAGLFAPRNVHDIQPFVSISPVAGLGLVAGTQFLWRNSTADAVYSPLGTPVVRAGGGRRYVATQPYLRVNWQINPLTTFLAGYVRAIPGGTLKEVGGDRRLDYAFASLDLQF